MMQMILYCSMEQNMFFFKEIQRYFVNFNFKFVDKYYLYMVKVWCINFIVCNCRI